MNRLIIGIVGQELKENKKRKWGMSVKVAVEGQFTEKMKFLLCLLKFRFHVP